MNTTFNKDNAAATILLTALFSLIAAAILTSAVADAKTVEAIGTKATPHIETIIVTATRLK